MDWLTAGAAGIVLAASAGLRAFLPLLGAGLAARFLDWPLAPAMHWLASDAGLIGLGVAALTEVAADKVPVVDHALDAVHTIVGPLAGALVAFSVWGDWPPAVATLLALALGAPVAGGVHLLAAATRLKSSAASGGVLNPVVSLVEDGLTAGAIVVVVLVPLVALALAIAVLIAVGRWVIERRLHSTGRRR